MGRTHLWLEKSQSRRVNYSHWHHSFPNCDTSVLVETSETLTAATAIIVKPHTIHYPFTLEKKQQARGGELLYQSWYQ